MGLAKATREDLTRLDRKRKKRMSNKEWQSPPDGEARITKMKDGRTHLAHKAENAVANIVPRLGFVDKNEIKLNILPKSAADPLNCESVAAGNRAVFSHEYQRNRSAAIAGNGFTTFPSRTRALCCAEQIGGGECKEKQKRKQ